MKLADVICCDHNMTVRGAAVACVTLCAELRCQLALVKRTLSATTQDHSCMYVIFLYCDDAQL
jgi:hypothetical protein